MKISVIVAVYNKKEQLKNILKCLSKQNEKPYEVIIADDGSKEDIKGVISEFQNPYFKIKHEYQEDKGFRLAASRNNGIKSSEGDFLIFIDQDAIFGENFIKNIRENIAPKRVLKVNDYITNEEEKNKIVKILKKDFEYKDIIKKLDSKKIKKLKKLDRKDLLYYLLYRMKLRKRGAKIKGLISGVFKKDCIKINGFDENYEGWGCEDDDFGNRLTALGIITKVVSLEEPLLHMYHDTPQLDGLKSVNEEYYNERKKIILNKREYRCKNGLIKFK